MDRVVYCIVLYCIVVEVCIVGMHCIVLLFISSLSGRAAVTPPSSTLTPPLHHSIAQSLHQAITPLSCWPFPHHATIHPSLPSYPEPRNPIRPIFHPVTTLLSALSPQRTIPHPSPPIASPSCSSSSCTIISRWRLGRTTTRSSPSPCRRRRSAATTITAATPRSASPTTAALP